MNSYLKILIAFIFCSFTSAAQINGVFIDDTLNLRITRSILPCDTLFSFPVKDTWPTGIAWDGNFLWSDGTDLDYIYKYNSSGILLDSIPGPNSIYGTQSMVFDGNYLWVLSEQENKIYKLDTISGSIHNQFDVPLNSNGFGLALDGSHLLAANYITSSLLTIDTSDGQIISNITLAKRMISIEIINNCLYGLSCHIIKDYLGEISIASNPICLYKIDKFTGALSDSIIWTIPYPLDISWDGSFLWNISSKVTMGGKQRAYKIDVSDIFTSIDKLHPKDQNSLSILPNPASEILTVIATHKLLGSSYAIVDFSGKQLIKGKLFNETTTIDIKELPAGIYVFRAGDLNKQSFKVIKE